MFYIILAKDSKNGIGKDGKLPWRLKKDMQFFKAITTSKNLAETEQEFGLKSDFTKSSRLENNVIMGRKTYLSIPDKYRPLPDRRSIVLTSNPDIITDEGVKAYKSIDEIVGYEIIESSHYYSFIAGGSQVYNEFLKIFSTTRIYLTEVDGDFECDTFIDDFPEEFKEIDRSEDFIENDITFRFKIYERQ